MFKILSLIVSLAIPVVGYSKTTCFPGAWDSISSSKKTEHCTRVAPSKVSKCLSNPSEYFSTVEKRKICKQTGATQHSGGESCISDVRSYLAGEKAIRLCAGGGSKVTAECYFSVRAYA